MSCSHIWKLWAVVWLYHTMSIQIDWILRNKKIDKQSGDRVYDLDACDGKGLCFGERAEFEASSAVDSELLLAHVW